MSHETFQANWFQIDGVNMPIPDDAQTKPKILTSESERLPATGRIIAPYLGTVLVTTWKYKYISEIDWDKLYDAYITSCSTKKSIEHKLRTYDSNTGKIIEYTMYTEDELDTPLYKIKNGIRYYSNITFTMTGVGGEIINENTNISGI